MLASIIAWNPDSQSIIYSAISGKYRKVYKEDIDDDVRYELKIAENDWFELAFIHEEQCIIHDWQSGLYLYDLVKKKSQLLREAKNCRSFYFDLISKQLFYNDLNDFYQYSHQTKKNLKLMNDVSELIVDPVHRTFITIDSDKNSALNIYYKNESVKEIGNAFLILNDKEFNHCFYCREKEELTEFYKLDLQNLKEEKIFEFDGFYHHGNDLENIAHFTIRNENEYQLLNFDKNKLTMNKVKSLTIDENIFSALSDDEKKIAILLDSEKSTEVKVLNIA